MLAETAGLFLDEAHDEARMRLSTPRGLGIQLVRLVPIEPRRFAARECVVEKAALTPIAERDVQSFERDRPALGRADARPVFLCESAEEILKGRERRLEPRNEPREALLSHGRIISGCQGLPITL